MGKDTNKLPSVMSLDKDQQNEIKKKVKRIRKKKKEEKFGSGQIGVCYVGHIPHGFYEDQMRKYFTQFGHVTRLRLARSKKTGKSKGYAFVEFANDAVAKVVAETMNNYLMFHKLLKCQYIPMEKVHPTTFRGANMVVNPRKRQIRAKRLHNNKRSTEREQQNAKALKDRKAKKLAKLAEMGIDFEYPGVVSIKSSDNEDTTETEMNISDIQKEAEELFNAVESDDESANSEESDEEEKPTPKRAKVSKETTSSVKKSPNKQKSRKLVESKGASNKAIKTKAKKGAVKEKTIQKATKPRKGLKTIKGVKGKK